MVEQLNLFLAAGAVIFSFMILLWLVSLALKNSSIVDIFWGAGFVIAAWVYHFLSPDGFVTRKILALALTSVWGLRLTIHILIRNWGKPEDFRYQKWRNETGKIWWIKSLFQVFLLQGALMWVISTPLLASQYGAKPAHLTILDFLGAALWIIGFFFEAMGDLQLTRFKSDPSNQGNLLNTGVWKYSRHPNYFGDAAQWWGFYLLAAAAGGWWTFFSPIIMTLFLIKVSGVAMLEKTLKNTKPGYQEYIQNTSAFIPWWPKNQNK